MPDLKTFTPSINDAYKGSYLTYVLGNDDAQEFSDQIAEGMGAAGVGRPATAFVVTGDEINAFAAEDGRPYRPRPPESRYIMFPLTGLSSGVLVAFRFSSGGRWFDDMVDNMFEDGE